jgi:hypothetical protein
MTQHRGPITPRIWNGDHQVNGEAHPLGHRGALQLSRPQLGLEVQERAFHLYGNHSSKALQHYVNRSPIRRRAHGDLQSNPPGWRCGDPDRLGDLQLPGVAQADAIGWIEAEDHVMASGSCEAMDDLETRHRATMLSLADQSLGDACSLRQLRLCQTGDRASGDELAGEAPSHLNCR